MGKTLEDRKVDVYVVNRSKNSSVKDPFTLQIGRNHGGDWIGLGLEENELRTRLNEIYPSNSEDLESPEVYWGYYYKNFPTLCSVVMMVSDICGKNLDDPWFGATLTYGEVVTLLKADLEKRDAT